jgi:hypothetical protein
MGLYYWDLFIKTDHKHGMRKWTGFIWHRISPMADYCEHGSETCGSIRGSERVK